MTLPPLLIHSAAELLSRLRESRLNPASIAIFGPASPRLARPLKHRWPNALCHYSEESFNAEKAPKPVDLLLIHHGQWSLLQNQLLHPRGILMMCCLTSADGGWPAAATMQDVGNRLLHNGFQNPVVDKECHTLRNPREQMALADALALPPPPATPTTLELLFAFARRPDTGSRWVSPP